MRGNPVIAGPLIGALLAATAAGADLPPETDLRPSTDGAWTIGGLLVEAHDGALTVRGERVGMLVERPVADPAGAWLAAALDVDGSVSLVWVTGDGSPSGWRVLATHGALDRIAVAPDGAGAVFAAPNSQGVTGLWYVDAETGAQTRLTNPEHPSYAAGNGPPPGFVPPPHRDPPRFVGDRVVWSAVDGQHEARLPAAPQ